MRFFCNVLTLPLCQYPLLLNQQYSLDGHSSTFSVMQEVEIWIDSRILKALFLAVLKCTRYWAYFLKQCQGIHHHQIFLNFPVPWVHYCNFHLMMLFDFAFKLWFHSCLCIILTFIQAMWILFGTYEFFASYLLIMDFWKLKFWIRWV